MKADSSDFHALPPTPTPVQEPHAPLPRLSVLSDGHVTPLAPSYVVRPRAALHTSVALVLLHAMQFGWMIPQLNLSTFQDQAACDARPVREGTCVMFPGHSAGEWAWVINLWFAGGMAGALGSGRVADTLGRKRALVANAVVMIVGAAVQASAPSTYVYAVGRFVSGLASGASTAIPTGYINEVAPPHLRNALGVLYQVALCVFIVLCGLTFFVADTATGWRFIGGFPMVLGALFLLGAPRFMVESPTWLLTHGRTDEADRVIARLYGPENVALARAWMAESTTTTAEHATASSDEVTSEIARHSPFRALFLPAFRRQTLLAVMLAIGQRLSGINTAFLYSSSLFTSAGLHDDRIGSLIINIVDLVPVFFSGWLGSRFGNRRMIIGGLLGMMVSAVGITAAQLVRSGALAIVFTAAYVACFAGSLGPLVYVVATSVFPHALRASGTALCLFVNWSATLAVGISYPHLERALGAWSFAPFIVALALSALFMARHLPDTTGKTGDEIQRLFQQRRLASKSRRQTLHEMP